MLLYILIWLRLLIKFFLLVWANVTVKTRMLSRTLRFNSQDIIQPEKGPSVACTFLFPLCHSEEPTLSKPLLQQNNLFPISTSCLYTFLPFYFFMTCRRFSINKHMSFQNTWNGTDNFCLSCYIGLWEMRSGWKPLIFPTTIFYPDSATEKSFIPCHVRGHPDTEVKPSSLNRGKWKVRNTCWFTFQRLTYASIWIGTSSAGFGKVSSLLSVFSAAGVLTTCYVHVHP